MRELARDKTGQLGLQVAQNAHRGAFTIPRGQQVEQRRREQAPTALAPATSPIAAWRQLTSASAAVAEPSPAVEADAATKLISAHRLRPSQVTSALRAPTTAASATSPHA